jgi:ABC-type thiamine transport system substrate-binding protein
MTIEAVSSKFLSPALSPDAQNTLAELGWQLSEEEGLPNYFQFLHKEEADPKIIAQLFAQTFRTIYGVTPSDTIEIRAGRGVWPSQSEEVENG